jgi:hypothetical protein
MTNKPRSPRKDNSADNRRNNSRSDIAWINYTLTTEHKTVFEQIIALDNNKLEAEMQTLAEEGYRWSISWDAYAGCWSCVMSTRDETSANSGKMMSSRSKSWYKALLMCMYKHLIIFEGHWIVDPDPDRDWEG